MVCTKKKRISFALNADHCHCCQMTTEKIIKSTAGDKIIIKAEVRDLLAIVAVQIKA
jgi:hypothetical protein